MANEKGNGKAKRPSDDAGALTFNERLAARKIGVSYRSILRYREAGMISFFRVGGRVLYDDQCVLEFLEKNRRTAAA